MRTSSEISFGRLLAGSVFLGLGVAGYGAYTDFDPHGPFWQEAGCFIQFAAVLTLLAFILLILIVSLAILTMSTVKRLRSPARQSQ